MLSIIEDRKLRSIGSLDKFVSSIANGQALVGTALFMVGAEIAIISPSIEEWAQRYNYRL